MSLHLVFMSGHDIEAVGYSPSVAWHVGVGRPMYTHVEIIMDGIGLCNFTGRTFIPTNKAGVRKYSYQRVRLPEHFKARITYEFNALDFRVPYRHRDFVSAARNGYCTRSILKTGWTCATFAAYMLGFSDYASISADQLYNRLGELS